MTMRDVVIEAFDALQWHFRAKDVKLIEGESEATCVPQIPNMQWRESDDPEANFTALARLSSEFWSSMKCVDTRLPIRYDPLLKAIVYSPEDVEELFDVNAGKEFVWLILGSAMYLHYLNHKAKFKLTETLKDSVTNQVIYFLVALSGSLTTIPWSFKGLKLFNNALGRAALRIVARKETIPLNEPKKIVRTVVAPSRKLNVCLSEDFCFDVDVEREAVSQRLDDLKLYLVVSFAEAPSAETLERALELV